MELDWVNEVSLGRDTALEEYKQQLWVTIAKTTHPAERRSLLLYLERINLHGREALDESP